MRPRGVSVTGICDNAYIMYLTYHLAIIHLLSAHFVLLIMASAIKKMAPPSLDGL